MENENHNTAKPYIECKAFEAHAYVFVASFCSMVIELVAGRIMAPYLGSSLYTWTSVIGVVLSGIALGNYVGGILAERGAGWRSVAMIFTFGGFAAALSYYIYVPAVDVIKAFNLPIQVATFLFAVAGFFPVSFLLSLITPIIVTLSLTSLKKTGTTIGRIYALSSTASILGTFISGFVLIPLLGVKTIVLSVAAILLLAGIFASRGRTTKETATKAALVLLWISFLTPKFCAVETAYYCVNIQPNQSEHGFSYRLVLDRLTHSYIFSEPRTLEYDYEAVYGVLAEYMTERLGGARPLATLGIGGGGYSMPRYLTEVYPGSQVEVVEIDPAVTRVNTDYFGLNPDGVIKTINTDARVFFTRGAEGKKYDLIFGDAFNDYSVPYHLTTVEFAKLVHDHLNPGGIYALNTIDDLSRGNLLASFVRTVHQVFPYVELSSSGRDWQKVGRNTYVILASDQPLDHGAWADAADAAYAKNILAPQPVTLDQMKTFASMQTVDELLSRKGSVALTDNYAPVDSLTAPLFRDM